MHAVVFFFCKAKEVITSSVKKQSIVFYHSVIVIRVSMFRMLTKQTVIHYLCS